MGIIDKAKNITEAIKNTIFKDEDFEPFYNARMEVCKTCDSRFGGICTKCGCVLEFKVRSRRINENGDIESCPLNKWHPILRVDNDGEYILKSELTESLRGPFKDERTPYAEFVKAIGTK
jgi:Family of unknown function (DUF6171)